jgi:WD40 repeat protein
LKKTLKLSVGHVIAVAFSPDGRTLAGAGSDTPSPGMQAIGNGRVTLWDVSTGEILRTLEGPTENAFEVAFSPDGRTIAVGGRGLEKMNQPRFSGLPPSQKSSEVRLWNSATGELMWIAEGESNSANSLSFSPDGKWLAFCDEDYVFIIDAGTGRLKQVVMETIARLRVTD